MRSREISVNGGRPSRVLSIIGQWSADPTVLCPGFCLGDANQMGEITGSINTLTADEFDGDDRHYFAF